MIKKVAAGFAGLTLIGAGVLGGFVLDNPETVIEYVDVVQIKEVPVTITETVLETEVVFENVSVENPLNLELREDLQDAKLVIQSACDKLLYDDVSECKDEIRAEDSAIARAINEIESEAADMLDDEDFGDEDEIKIVRIYDDFEDIDVTDSDYDDNEYSFDLRVKVDNDGDKEYYIFSVDVEDGKAEIVDVIAE